MTSLLGGLAPSTFLRTHWHQRPLLVRQALPGFRGLFDRDALLALTARDDVTSRLVLEHPGHRARWERRDGPFLGLDAAMLPPSHWTVLVHGIESAVAGGWELLRRFAFVPAARIDDLMVSYAVDRGSVGPHDDLYDVFLLQGPGRRRWQVSTRGERALDDRAAIKVLRAFVPEEEWLLEPGDLLYLPPGVAHYGIAEGPCFTYSIGFLSPSRQDLIQSFLGFAGQALGATTDPEALVPDTSTRVQPEPLAVSDQLVREVASVIDTIRWDRSLVEDFVGCFLTRPKPNAVFQPPARPLGPEPFARRLRRRGQLVLALPSRGLVRRDRIFFNGEAHRVAPALRRQFTQLVRDRALALPLSLDERALELVHPWYLAGWLRLR